ncbi:hypothetical protein EJB05_49366 [Eragrostis curvula]|uniref:Uncharacterized protein n=1 Tax=Eragrostis curvula TaxID=38414 RepID=A0A5J9T4L2_9POAL|nr:hypothetical protein EJB05_49366 [Eragrostis curvula]
MYTVLDLVFQSRKTVASHAKRTMDVVLHRSVRSGYFAISNTFRHKQSCRCNFSVVGSNDNSSSDRRGLMVRHSMADRFLRLLEEAMAKSAPSGFHTWYLSLDGARAWHVSSST